MNGVGALVSRLLEMAVVPSAVHLYKVLSRGTERNFRYFSLIIQLLHLGNQIKPKRSKFGMLQCNALAYDRMSRVRALGTLEKVLGIREREREKGERSRGGQGER